jgi:hypothetical protein
MRGRTFPSIWAVAAAAVSACGAPPSGQPAAAVVTLSTLQAGYQAGADQPFGVGLSRVFEGGFPPAYFLASPDRIRVAPAYTEGEQTAYMTTDLWVNFPVVWVQPLYLFVSDWNAQDPNQHLLDLPWVFSVGPESAFWSPFHRVTYVQVPAATPADRYRTVREILRDGLPLFPGPTRLVTLVPSADMGPEETTRFLLPQLRQADRIGRPTPRRGWLDRDGEEVFALDFGENRFEYNERDEVLDQPLFFFFGRGEDGRWAPHTTIPRVGGTGPLFSGRAPLAPGNRPAFGSHWRLYAVHLPATARVFVPRERRPEWEARNGGPGLGPPAVDAPPGTVATTGELDAHAFKVVLDETCLARPALTAADLTACPWLDSQASLERHLGHALYPSEILVACPYLSFGGTAVPSSPP